MELAAVILPYRTDWRELAAILEYCKGKGADRAVLDARFGSGEGLRETLNALEQLALVVRDDSGDVRLTDLGERLAYAPDRVARQAVLLEALVAYTPYRIPFERALGDGLGLLDGPWVEHVWQVDMRLGQPRNRVEEARTFFFRLADEAGLGSYRRGVRGQTTRLELAGDFAARLTPLLELPHAPAEPAAGFGDTGQIAAPAAWQAAHTTAAAVGSVTLALQVDLTEWELDKIAAFFRLIGYPPAE